MAWRPVVTAATAKMRVTAWKALVMVMVSMVLSLG
jgi:hypothetical protein